MTPASSATEPADRPEGDSQPAPHDGAPRLPTGAPQPLSLALQGGGAHGAYTWGVLDALLASGRIAPGVLSGASAGAVNAVVLAHGWQAGGAAGARAALAAFWRDVALHLPQWLAPWLDDDQGGAVLGASARWMMQWTQFLAPTQINPLRLDPLRQALLAHVDFAALRRPGAPRLWIAATHALTGRLRLFGNAELTVEAVLASACLPGLHHTVHIDGEPYWDGGYSANPALFPLLREAPRDCLIVMLAPSRHAAVPTTAAAIRARVAEIAFNAVFLREARLLGEWGLAAPPRRWPWPWHWLGGWLDRRRGRGGDAPLRFHLIDAQPDLGHLPPETRLLAHTAFLDRLHALGHQRAQAWLAHEGQWLGRAATVDLRRHFE